MAEKEPTYNFATKVFKNTSPQEILNKTHSDKSLETKLCDKNLG